MSTATATAPVRNGNSAPAPAAPKPAWMSFSDPKQFPPSVQAATQEYLTLMRPVNLFLKTAAGLIAEKPEGTYKAEATGGKQVIRLVDNEECAAFFEYFRKFMETRRTTHVLAKVSTVEEWNKLVAQAIRATKAAMQGRKDARDEEHRKQVVACLKCVNSKFSLTFFLDNIADACEILAEYKDLEGDGYYIGRLINTCAKETNSKAEDVTFEKYLAWAAKGSKTPKRVVTAAPETPADLDDMAGEW